MRVWKRTLPLAVAYGNFHKLEYEIASCCGALFRAALIYIGAKMCQIDANLAKMALIATNKN